MKRTVIVSTAVLSALLLWVGAGLHRLTSTAARAADAAAPEVKPLFGRECVVHLRRDALGLAVDQVGKTPQWPDGDKGDKLAVRGRVVVMDDRWVVLRDADGQDHWVPLIMVMMVDPARD